MAFANNTTDAQNLAAIEENRDAVLRHDPEIHYFLLETSRNVDAALDGYRKRQDVEYAFENFCVQLYL